MSACYAPAYDNGSGEGRPPLIMIDGEEEFELQTTLQHRLLNKTNGDSGINYLVKWKGYGPVYNYGSLSAGSSKGLLKRCKTIGTRLVLLCKQLVLGWNPTKVLLLLEAGVEHLVSTVAEVAMHTEVHSELSAS